jgi:hypothetical protein
MSYAQHLKLQNPLIISHNPKITSISINFKHLPSVIMKFSTILAAAFATIVIAAPAPAPVDNLKLKVRGGM